jgi:hypothetical protein
MRNVSYRKLIEAIKMRILLIIFVTISTVCYSQDKLEFYGIWKLNSGEFYYELDLKRNGSFEWQHSFSLGSTSSSGKWQVNNDTLKLFDYAKPWTIQVVEEFKVDSLENETLLIFKLPVGYWPKESRREGNLYIDGNLIEGNKYDPSKLPLAIDNFHFWINNDCQQDFKTDSLGKANLEMTPNSIQFVYNKYEVKDQGSNLIIITINQLPIYVSPPTLYWDEWILDANGLKPIECNKRLNHLQLKK